MWAEKGITFSSKQTALTLEYIRVRRLINQRAQEIKIAEREQWRTFRTIIREICS